jgi:hypothetical protein
MERPKLNFEGKLVTDDLPELKLSVNKSTGSNSSSKSDVIPQSTKPTNVHKV